MRGLPEAFQYLGSRQPRTLEVLQMENCQNAFDSFVNP